MKLYEPQSESARQSNLDILRAFSAVAVCLFHFSRNSTGLSKTIFSYGYLGVDSFFVISGFVIPLSLHHAKYSWKAMPAFLSRRFIRLYPAFLVACALCIGLIYLSSLAPGFQGSAVSLDWKTITCNLTLTCGVFQRTWLNPVAWTLTVEIQYYIFIALAFPLLTHPRVAVRTTVLILWILAPLFSHNQILALGYGALFSMGCLIYLRWANLIRQKPFICLLTVAFIIEGHKCNWDGAAMVGLLSAAFIAFAPTLPLRPVLFIGSISYSLYLVHVPIGGRIINLASRIPGGLILRTSTVCLALLASIGFAYGFFLLVEKPFHHLAKKIHSPSKSTVNPIS